MIEFRLKDAVSLANASLVRRIVSDPCPPRFVASVTPATVNCGSSKNSGGPGAFGADSAAFNFVESTRGGHCPCANSGTSNAHTAGRRFRMQARGRVEAGFETPRGSCLHIITVIFICRIRIVAPVYTVARRLIPPCAANTDALGMTSISGDQTSGPGRKEFRYRRPARECDSISFSGLLGHLINSSWL